MTITKPSAGALKAAAIVYQRYRRNEPTYAPVEVPIVAEVIDRESGLAEALDALRGMVGLVQLIQSTESPAQKHLVMSNHRFIEAQRVIAKAENPNAETVQSYPAGRWTEKGTA